MSATGDVCCGCGGAAGRACDYCGRPLCDAHALAPEALRRLGWDLVPGARTLCRACHGEQYWQLIARRLLLWGSLGLLALALVVSWLPLPGWGRYALVAGAGVIFTAGVLVAHRRRDRFLAQRVAAGADRGAGRGDGTAPGLDRPGIQGKISEDHRETRTQ